MGKSGLRLLPAAFVFLLLLVAGCGAVSSGSGTSALVISAQQASIDTTLTDKLTARLASGSPANVTWSIVAGQNDAGLGQGTISANGLYIPPTVLAQDQ